MSALLEYGADAQPRAAQRMNNLAGPAPHLSRLITMGMTMRPHILVVEDDESVGDVICEILEGKYEVTRAAAMGTALAALARQPIDALLLDYHLSDGCGRRVAEYAAYAGIPTIWMTGDPNALAGLGYVPQFSLPKPFGMRDLLDMVDTLLQTVDGFRDPE